MKKLKRILIIAAVIVVVFLIVAAMQPAAFRVERSVTMAAPAAEVFAQVNDFHKWEAWSPWAKLDPNMKTTYEGPAAGAGAAYSWVGDSKVGEGKMTIMDAKPNELVRVKLEFLKPMSAVNTAEFTFKPEGNGTSVTWAMYGEKNFMMKAFCMIMSMDKMVGGDFEKGLTAMKGIVEAKK